ncbi:MAG: N-acetylmuramoyl-L-alanine amidase [Streptomyces sp.]|nr:N-acetylmuramoyl-L-alanine amidase [Streptomyces sp.]
MATPLTADRLIAVLKAEGVRVSEYPGWRTRERDDETGLKFGPVHLVLNHHTAGSSSRDIVAKNGVAGLPGPLAHIYLGKDGTATLCSDGRANHAGAMARNAYDSFLNERSTHPAPSRASGTVDGNDCSYGIETENLGNGKDVYTRAQYDAWVRINAAFCRVFGWSSESCAGHKETSVEGKVDPLGPVEGYGTRGRFSFSMGQFRKDVAERLKYPASWSPSTAPAPAPKPPAPKPTPTPSVEDRLSSLEKRVTALEKG